MTYPGTLSLSRAHLTHLADLLRGHRTRIGSRWRKLPPGRQALLVLAHLRNGDTYTRLAAGFGIGLATVYRYVREATDLLAANAPSLTAALWRLAGNGHRLGILDGTLVRTDRLGGDLDRLYYSGKHRQHGVNLQGLVDPRRGDLAWISDGLPGSTHDLTAARTHGVIATATRAEVELLADKGYQGAGGTVTSPHKGRKLTKQQKAHNRMVNSVRGPGERGFATLKAWRLFTRIRCCPNASAPSPRPYSLSNSAPNHEVEKGSLMQWAQSCLSAACTTRQTIANRQVEESRSSCSSGHPALDSTGAACPAIVVGARLRCRGSTMPAAVAAKASAAETLIAGT